LCTSNARSSKSIRHMMTSWMGVDHYTPGI
jgi:hypothetical protein